MGYDVMYERVSQELVETRAALAAMTAERDRFLIQVDVLEAALKTTAEERDDWKELSEAESLRAERAEAKLEAVEAIVAQAITDPYLIAHLEAALATIGPSLRECPRCKRVETVLEKWRAEWDRGWDRSTELCIEEIEAALALEDRPV